MTQISRYRIVPANDDHTNALRQKLKRFAKISGTQIPPDADALLGTLHDPIKHRLIVAEHDTGHGHELVGCIYIIASATLINLNVAVATEGFWWVDEEHRSSGIGRALLRAAEEAAKLFGCEYMHVMALEALSPDKVGAMYESEGYTLIEHTYEKRL